LNIESAKELRQKAINLIYLILLALLFSFIPSDFVDSVHHSDSSLNMLSDDVERLNNEKKVLFLRALRQIDQYSFESTKEKLGLIDQHTQNALSSIDGIKFELVNVEKYNAFGFLVNGKRETVSNEIMIDKGKAKVLIQEMIDYKGRIKDLVSSDDFEIIDSLLPTPKLLRYSDGDFTSIEAFYFHKNPLNITMLNLSHFKSRVEEVRSFLVQRTFDEQIDIHREELPKEVVQIIEQSKHSVGNANFIQEFYENLEKQAALDQEKKIENEPYLYVESLTDSVYASGQPLRFKVQFDTAQTNSVQASVKKNGSQIENFNLSQSGTFLFTPQKKGVYEILFKSPEKQVVKRVKIIDVEPVLQNESIATLYIGIDNALDIRTSEFEDVEQLDAIISEGEILKKGKNFYARVNKEGLVDVQVIANMPYGKVKLAEKQFAVRELVLPVARLNSVSTGNSVSKSQVAKLKKLEVTSNEYLVEEQFFISDFEFTIIYNNHTAILQPIKNIGSSLNASSLDAISRAQKGDILIINKIKAKSSLGNEVSLAPLNISVE
jgi:hypothetical protein